MYQRISRTISKILSSSNRLEILYQRQQQILINQGRFLSSINKNKEIGSINDVEFKVFSQWGEDGIIQYLINNLYIENRTFIEFGVEDFSEANCRFLMESDNWSGFIIDGSDHYINSIKSTNYYWKYHLTAHNAFIDRDNINQILNKSGFERNVGILSIDIDGVDFWVAKALEEWIPSILIMEYNAVFGADRAITVPYDPQFVRKTAHYSNLYFGASLKALYLLAKDKGYEIVGTNSAGNNAFFVRKELLNERVKAKSVEDSYSQSAFRESRGKDGRLTFVSGADRIELIRGMPVFDVELDQMTVI